MLVWRNERDSIIFSCAPRHEGEEDMEDATAKEHIEALYRGIAGMPDIEPAEIPKLDLYMDQVITLFESVLEPTKRHPEDKLLTKTISATVPH
ncbi:DUF1836 domain-containing protein [Bacillus paralicheniformis]|uniref:DUF1836 domain-containing protein n=1 Tax=Bacillus paralicheniformis TaxID=1648923 RepID=UPI003BF9C233